MYPTLKSCKSSPATADETQTTAATPRTAATPEVPETPNATIRRAAISRVESVKPEIGLLDEPMNPTRLPDTVAKKKPTKIITTAARIAGHTSPEILIYSKHMSTNITAIKPNTIFELIYLSVRGSLACCSAVWRRSANALPSPAVRLARILKRVKAAPTSIPPTAMGRTMYRQTASAIVAQLSGVSAGMYALSWGPRKKKSKGTISPH